MYRLAKCYVLWTVLILAIILQSAALSYPDGQLPYSLPPSGRQPGSVQHVQPNGDPGSTSLNLIDLLSQSPQHSILLRLLQRVRLIPTLNRLQEFDDGTGLTLLAPTNEAFLKKRDDDRQLRLQSMGEDSQHKSLWEYVIDDENASTIVSDSDHVVSYKGQMILRDNVNAVVRQHLLYHLLNYTLPFTLSNNTGIHSPQAPLPEPGKPELHITMHFPSRRLLTEPTKPGHIPSPDQEDHGGLLGDEGQRIRVALQDDRTQDSSGRVTLQTVVSDLRKKGPVLAFGTDTKGSGGARSLFEDWRSDKGVIHTIDAVLDLPPPLDLVLNEHRQLESLRRLLDADTIRTLSTVPHLTLFLPASDAFSKLSFLEQAYLFGDFQQAVQDRLKLMGWHMSGLGLGNRRPVYADEMRQVGRASMTTTLGGSIEVETDTKDGLIRVLDSSIVEEDILTENGVVHIIDGLILPFGDLDLSVEKTLLALNASRFVDLIYASGLEHYINKPAHLQRKQKDAFTFLAPRDDVIDAWPQGFMTRANSFASSEDPLKPSKGPTLEEVIRYHILPGKIEPKDLENRMLLDTELKDWKLREGRQKMPVQVDDSSASSDRKGNGDVGFGDANVLRDPVELGDHAVIYVVSQLLQPPSDPVQTAVSFLSLSTFVAAIFSADLKGAVERAPGVTYLVPTNDAFSGLGLAMKYLLLPGSQPLLQALVEYHAIDRIAYMSDFSETETRFPTLLPTVGADLSIKKHKDGVVTIRREGDDNGSRSSIVKADILTNTGVIHEIDKVQIPFDMTIRNLLKGAKADTMEDLMTQAGYGHILNATLSQDGSDTGENSYVVLVPTDSAFTRVNLSSILEDPDTLRRLVQQHIIPLSNSQQIGDLLPDGRKDGLSLQDESSFPTLLDRSAGGQSRFGSISFRKYVDEKASRLSNKANSLRFRNYDAPSDEDLGWIVGIKDTRGSTGQRHSARILAFGREAREIQNGGSLLRSGIGGVLQIDAVLTPYEPSWFYRWGWIVLASMFTAAVLSSAALAAYRWYKRDGKIRLPEALEGEEE